MIDIIKKVMLLVFCLCVVTQVQAANDKAFAWQATSGNVTITLMGSIHFANESFYPLRKEIETAFEHAQVLVVELDINKIDSANYNRMISELGSYKDGTTIKDVISEETWLQLRQRLRHLNVSYDAIKSYRPGVLVLTLSSLQLMQMGFDPRYGMDYHFLKKATDGTGQKKEIIELESLEQQLKLFLNIPDSDLLLKESLYSLDESELLMADMVRFWKQGDTLHMSKLLFEDALEQYPAFGAIYDRLFYQRNDEMTAKIERMLKGVPIGESHGTETNVDEKAETGARNYFIVVGSGHLVGEKGIVNLLQKKGYTLKRI